MQHKTYIRNSSFNILTYYYVLLLWRIKKETMKKILIYVVLYQILLLNSLLFENFLYSISFIIFVTIRNIMAFMIIRFSDNVLQILDSDNNNSNIGF